MNVYSCVIQLQLTSGFLLQVIPDYLNVVFRREMKTVISADNNVSRSRGTRTLSGMGLGGGLHPFQTKI